MTSFISLILSVFMFFTSFFIPSATAPVPENADDDFVPVVRFIATSDTHIATLGDKGCMRTAKMINSAYAYADADKDYTNLDAVIFAGDVTDDGAFTSFASFVATTDSVIREGTERLAVLAKSHDSNMYGTKALDFYNQMTGQETDFHRVINGFHFIGISRSADAMHYAEEQKTWLDEQLNIAVKDAPLQPVFVFNHEHIKDTVFGSYDKDGWGMDFFKDVLEKYPQVIDISGHSHYPANDPRAIWQGTYTAINDGGLAYYEFTVDDENAVHPHGSKTMTQALLIEVDASNRVLVKVLDVDKGVFVAEYLIDNVASPVKLKYNFEARKLLSTAPDFGDKTLSVSEKNGKYTVTVPQATVNEDNKVFLYRLTVTDADGNITYTAWELSEYYFADVPETITFDKFNPKGGITISVVAEDVWGNESEALTFNIG